MAPLFYARDAHPPIHPLSPAETIAGYLGFPSCLDPILFSFIAVPLHSISDYQRLVGAPRQMLTSMVTRALLFFVFIAFPWFLPCLTIPEKIFLGFKIQHFKEF